MNIINANSVSSSQTLAGQLGGRPPAAADFLTFGVGVDQFAVDMGLVQEIRSYEEPAVGTDAPDFIILWSDRRGVVVPLMDLRIRFGAHSATPSPYTEVLVLNVHGRQLAVVVDAVSDVVKLDHAQFAGSQGAAADSVSVGPRKLHLLDVEALVSSLSTDGTHTASVLQ